VDGLTFFYFVPLSLSGYVAWQGGVGRNVLVWPVHIFTLGRGNLEGGTLFRSPGSTS